MLSKKKLVITTGSAAAILLLATQIAWTNKAAVHLEGAWVARVPGTPLLWTYSMAPDPSGKSASISGSVQVPVMPKAINPALFPDAEYVSPMVGRIVMTGPHTAQFTALWYGLKKGVPFEQVVFIGVTSGQIQFKGPGKSEVTHNLGFYDPSTDANNDGLPDEGAAATLCLPATSTDTQLPLLPPCTP